MSTWKLYIPRCSKYRTVWRLYLIVSMLLKVHSITSLYITVTLYVTSTVY